jgi:hypothetical protein
MRFELTYPRDNNLAGYRLNHSATLSAHLRKAAPHIRLLTSRDQAIEGTVQIGRTNLLQKKNHGRSNEEKKSGELAYGCGTISFLPLQHE